MPNANRKRSTLAELDRCTGCLPRKSTAASHTRHAVDEFARRRAGSRRRGVFALVGRNGHGPSGSKTTVTCRAYDQGAPIVTPARHVSRAHSVPDWSPVGFGIDGFESTSAFAVESFEDGAVVEPVTAPVAGPSPFAGDAPEVPVAKALALGADEDGYLGLDLSTAARAEDADEFERQIQSILSGQTVRPSQAASVQEPPPESGEVRPLPESAHQIFEQMGQNMAYATSFNLPPLEVRRRFDAIERELAREEAMAAAPAAVSLELSDEDIAEGLTMTAVAPASQPAVTPVGAESVSTPPSLTVQGPASDLRPAPVESPAPNGEVIAPTLTPAPLPMPAPAPTPTTPNPEPGRPTP